MKKLVAYSFIILLGLSNLSFIQMQSFDPNAKVKAVFIYNFTRYFEWPDKMKSGNFVIHTLGNNPSIISELNKMALSKQVGNQKLEIKSANNIDNSLNPHIIFLLGDASDLLKDVMSKYKGKGALIVTEKSGMSKSGSAINFVIIDNKQKFEYSVTNAKKAGLKTSDELKSLSIEVD